MTWQIALGLFLILGVCTFLSRRLLARRFATHNRLVNGFLYVVFMMPLGLGVATITSPNLAVGWTNLALLAATAGIFPVVALLAYRANHDIDAGVYSIFTNLTPVVSIVVASLWLHEVLNGKQLIGAAIILLAALRVTLPQLERGRIRSRKAIVFTLAAILIFGCGVVYERFLLTRVDLGAYTFYAWTFQAMMAAAIAWPERHAITTLLSTKVRSILLLFCFSTCFRGLFFVLALSLCTNASEVMAFASFFPVLVVVAAFIFLKERKWLWLKLSAAAIGVVGLVLLEIA